MSLRHRIGAGLTAATLVAVLAACSDSGSGDTTPDASNGEALTLYSGRSENLVGPLVEQLEGTLGFPIDVVYGGTPEITGKLVEEGAASPADVVFSQDAGALGLLDRSGLLEQLPASVTNQVPENYRAEDSTWVATSARARVLVYNDDKVQPQDLPSGIDGLLDPKWKGQVGFAPTNASFQSFVTGLRVSRGEDGAREWLEAFKANEPVASKQRTSHGGRRHRPGDPRPHQSLLLVRARGREGRRQPCRAAPLLRRGRSRCLVNIAGAAVLATTDQREQAEQFVAALLSPESQTYFADETAEYPVVEGTETQTDLRPLSEIGTSDIELAELASLAETQALLQELEFI